MADGDDINEPPFNLVQNLRFVYLMRKGELIEVLTSQRLDTTGKVQDLRHRLYRHLQKCRDDRSTQNLCDVWEATISDRLKEEDEDLDKVEAVPSEKPTTEPKPAAAPFVQTSYNIPALPNHTAAVPIPVGQYPQHPQPPNRYTLSYEAEVMNTVRKWGLKFDGTSNPLEFLERITELTGCYNIPRDNLLRTLPELFRGNALEWLRIKLASLKTWEDFHQAFIQYFLPPRYLSKLEDEIFRRRQGPRENAKDYILKIQYLIYQHPRMTVQDNLDRIFDGLRPEYRLYARRNDFRTIDELLLLVEECEAIKRDERYVQSTRAPVNTVPTNPRPRLSASSEPYDRQTHCWNCKQRGHRKESCRRPFRLFCSFCGQDGTLTKDCNCRRSNVAVISNLPTSDPRPYVPITAGNYTYQALLDTGSTKTYIGKKLRDYLRQIDIPCKRVHQQISLANGTVAIVSEKYNVTLILNKEEVTTEVAYLPALDSEMLIGMDTLTKVGLQMLIGGQLVKSNNPESVCHICSVQCATVSHLRTDQNKKLEEFLETELPAFENLRDMAHVPPYKVTTVRAHIRDLKQTNPDDINRPAAILTNHSGNIDHPKAEVTVPILQFVIHTQDEYKNNINKSTPTGEKFIHHPTAKPEISKPKIMEDKKRSPSPRYQRLASLERVSEPVRRSDFRPIGPNIDPTVRVPTLPSRIKIPKKPPSFELKEPRKPPKIIKHDRKATPQIIAKTPVATEVAKIRKQRKAAAEIWRNQKGGKEGKARKEGFHRPVSVQATEENQPSTSRQALLQTPSYRGCIIPVVTAAVREEPTNQDTSEDPFQGITLRGKQHHRIFKILRPWGWITVRMNHTGTQASLRYKQHQKIINVVKNRKPS